MKNIREDAFTLMEVRYSARRRTSRSVDITSGSAGSSSMGVVIS